MYFTQFEYATEPNMCWNVLMCIQYLRLKIHKSDIALNQLLLLTRTKKRNKLQMLTEINTFKLNYYNWNKNQLKLYRKKQYVIK